MLLYGYVQELGFDDYRRDLLGQSMVLCTIAQMIKYVVLLNLCICPGNYVLLGHSLRLFDRVVLCLLVVNHAIRSCVTKVQRTAF